MELYTSICSVAGVGKSSDKLKYFQENIEKIKKESQELATELDEWIKDTETLVTKKISMSTFLQVIFS